jgi:hypothetical protein
MSSQDETSETQQAKSFFCHSCSNNFRKAPDQVNIIEGMLAVFFAATNLSPFQFQEFVCPSCHDGFIEELPENSNNMSQNDSDDHEDFAMRGVFSDFVPFQTSGSNNTPYMRIANEILGPIITGSLGGVASTSG